MAFLWCDKKPLSALSIVDAGETREWRAPSLASLVPFTINNTDARASLAGIVSRQPSKEDIRPIERPSKLQKREFDLETTLTTRALPTSKNVESNKPVTKRTSLEFPAAPHTADPIRCKDLTLTTENIRSSKLLPKRPSRELLTRPNTAAPLLTTDISPNEEQNMDDDTHGSSTRDSAISGLSILDSETDEFYKQSVDLSKKEADEKRMQNLIKSNIQPFRKARPTNRVALTLENLQWNDAAVHVPKETQKDASYRPSTSGSDSTGSPNVPRQWGRKGRQRNDFLKRLNSMDEEGPRAHPSDPNTILRRRTLFTGDSFNRDDGRPASAGADDGSHSVRGQPVSMHPKRHSISAAQRTNPSLDQIIELEKEQALAADRAPSSKPDPRKSEDTRQREIDRLKKSAVITNRLAEDRRSLRRPRLTDAFRKTDATSGMAPGEWDGQKDQFSTRLKSSRSMPDSLKSQKTVGFSSDTTMARDAPVSLGERGKTTSSELLRQFARASSSTPTSSSGSPKLDVGKRSRDTSNLSVAHNSDRKVPDGTQDEKKPLKPKPLNTNLPNIDIHKKVPSPTEVSPIEVVGMISPPGSRDGPPAHVAAKHATLLGSDLPKTPKVAGAWVDTPTTYLSRRRLSDSALVARKTGLDEAQNPPNNATILKSEHPKSALEALLQGARNQNQQRDKTQPDLGDATIASLQDLAAEDSTAAQSLLELDDDTLDLVANASSPRLHTSSKQPSFEAQRQEQLALRRMALTLHTARLGLRDTSRRIKDMETQVDIADADDTTQQQQQQQLIPGSACPHCGHTRITLGTVLRATADEFLEKLYYVRRPDGRVRLTTLGVFSALFALWLLVELTLYECCTVNPLHYADRRYAHLVPRPRLPFVAVEMAMQPLEAYWRPFLGPFLDAMRGTFVGEVGRGPVEVFGWD